MSETTRPARRLPPWAKAAGFAAGLGLLLATDDATWHEVCDFADRLQDARLSWTFFRHFGSLWATFLAIALTHRLARDRMRLVPALLAATLLTGAFTALLKPAFGRVRPDKTDGKTEFRGPAKGFAAVFGGEKFPQSFPSGHATTAFANAYGLTAMYPPAKPVFLVCAALSAGSRVEAEAHFVSDVYAGGLIGWFGSAWVFAAAERLRRKYGRGATAPAPGS